MYPWDLLGVLEGQLSESACRFAGEAMTLYPEWTLLINSPLNDERYYNVCKRVYNGGTAQLQPYEQGLRRLFNVSYI